MPTWDGTTIGMLPGYRPNVTANYNPANPQIGQAYHYQPTDLAAFDDVQIIDRQERANVFASANFQLGDVNWATEFLYNRRTTETYRLRQFFPLIGGITAAIPSYKYTDGSSFAAPVPNGIARPVMPFSSMQDVKIDYYFLNTSLDGLIKSTDSWAWKANLSHSESSGEYNVFNILKSLSGDADPALRPWTGGKSPSINYFEPCILDGSCMSKVENAIGRWGDRRDQVPPDRGEPVCSPASCSTCRPVRWAWRWVASSVSSRSTTSRARKSVTAICGA